MAVMTISTAGGSAAVLKGFAPPLPILPVRSVSGGTGVYFVNLHPVQVTGFIPLSPCTSTECRTEDEWKNPVFGNLQSGQGINTPTYENDVNGWLLDYQLWSANPNDQPTVTVNLEELISGVWTTVGTAPINFITTNSFGTIAGHKSYYYFSINWGKVIQFEGNGIYRVKVTSTFGLIISCLATPCFHALLWDCQRAKGTVKWENRLTGKIGDKRSDYVVYDLCKMWLYDSVRVKGWFGYEKVSEYREVMQEWGKPKHGKIERVRDEAIQRYEYLSNYLPKYLHERFAIYGMMADELRVSDYNIHNSDFNLKRMVVVKDGSFEPEYLDNKGQRLSKVKVFFKRGVQSIIKSICCEVIK